MKKILFLIFALFLLAGCTTKEDTFCKSLDYDNFRYVSSENANSCGEDFPCGSFFCYNVNVCDWTIESSKVYSIDDMKISKEVCE